MSLTLLAVVVALVLGHVAPGLMALLRQFGWYARWVGWLGHTVGDSAAWASRFGAAIALVPPLLLLALVQWGLDGRLFGFPSLLLGLLTLAYAWGPRDLDVDVEAILDAPDPLARHAAIARLEGDEATARSGLVELVFGSALRRWFGVLFWFLLLGPVGALLYRLSAISAHAAVALTLPPPALAGARQLQRLLDWPVAQAMTASLALVGNFDAVFSAWRSAGGTRLQVDTDFLGAAARASVGSELAEEAHDYIDEGMAPSMGELPELRDAMSLVWRILLLWLALLAMFVIAGWVS